MGDVVERAFVVVGQMHGHAPLPPRQQEILDADVRKGASRHDLVVAAPCAVLVEVFRRDAYLTQVDARRTARANVPRGRNVVRRDGVPEHREHACVFDVLDRFGLQLEAIEIRRFLDVGRPFVPGVEVTGRRRELLPLDRPFEHVRIPPREHLGPNGGAYRLIDLRLGRPDILQEDRAVRSFTDRFVIRIPVHSPRQRVCDHEWRRRKVVRPSIGVHAAFEVAVTGEHGASDEVVLLDGRRDRFVERAGVANAGRAAVADEVEAELVEVGRNPCRVEIVGDDL